MGTHLILVTLLSLCSLSFSQECIQEVLEDVDLSGTNITAYMSSDVKECQRLCNLLKSCLFFTFIRPDWTGEKGHFNCYLKSTPSGQPEVQTPLPGVTSGFALKTCNLNAECIQEPLENVDLPGTDIKVLYSPDVKHCQQLCTQHPSCRFFTFIRPDWTKDNRHFHCYLKSTDSGQPNVKTPLPGVTSGFSLKTCEPHKRDCYPQVYQDVDFLGADYRSLFTADYQECQRICTHDPGCQFFTFVNEVFTPQEIRYKCHLKFSWRLPRIPIIEKNFSFVSGFSQKAEITQYFDTACPGKLLSDTDIVGSNMEMLLAISPEQCQTFCSAHPLCTYFSYSSDDFKCYLKNNPNKMVTRSMEGVTSGMPERFCQQDNSWVKDVYERIDFRGSEIGYELMVDEDMCQKKCTKDPNCQFYTYIPDLISPHWRRCTLKRVITMPAPPKVTKLPNVVSGFSLKDCVQIHI